MSLINEALKKAQSEQYGKDAPSARTPGPGFGSAPSGRVVRPAALALVLLVVAGVSAGAWYMLVPAAEEPAAPVRPAIRPKPPAPVVAEAKPAVPVPAPAPAKVDVVAVAVEKPAPTAPKANPAVAALVEVMRVSFARAETGRCVVDGVVHRTGDKVVDEPRITLTKVTDSRVIFMDAAGCEYPKDLSH